MGHKSQQEYIEELILLSSKYTRSFLVLSLRRNGCYSTMCAYQVLDTLTTGPYHLLYSTFSAAGDVVEVVHNNRLTAVLYYMIKLEL